MLIEGLVGIMALIAATALFPGDYFAINTPPATFANLGIPVVNLPDARGGGRRDRRRTAPAAPSRSPSASRRSSAACPACAA